MNGNSICVIIPAFNEGEVIEDILKKILDYSYTIVLVDDGSMDETYDKASLFPIHLIRHACNLGQGASLQTGIKYALGLSGIKIIVTFDADGQHDPSEIEKICFPILNGCCDVVLGSRFVQENLAKNLKKIKYILLKIAILYTRMITGLKITDTHNGFRAFSSYAAGKISITQNGMSHASQILQQISQYKLRYCEVPVTIIYTDYSVNKGQSILNSINILWESFFGDIK